MKWVLIVLGALVAVVAVVFVVGMLRPRSHVATVAVRLATPPDSVWAVISDFASVPSWFSEITAVERIVDHEGHPAYRETFKGGFGVTVAITESLPSRRLVREILPGGPFFGSWTWELEAAEGGTRLTITERGTVPNPFFRAMMIFHDNTKTMRDYATALGRRLGTQAIPM
jgi:uncharacterized protein YndB with AHSA1/START domain